MDRLELQLSDLPENTAQAEIAAQMAAEKIAGAIVRAPRAGPTAAAGALPWERLVLSGACGLPHAAAIAGCARLAWA